jgi:hypothetical protein
MKAQQIFSTVLLENTCPLCGRLFALVSIIKLGHALAGYDLLDYNFIDEIRDGASFGIIANSSQSIFDSAKFSLPLIARLILAKLE